MNDILLNSDFDLDFENGDLVVGNAKYQSIELLLTSSQGEWKEHPEAGADIKKNQNGVIDQSLERNIRVQLVADNFNLDKLIINENGFQISGDYEGI